MLAIGHSTDGRIATITLNRPDKRNALNQEMVRELTSVIQSLATDDFLRTVVITGAGNVFSAGADLAALEKMHSGSPEENLEDSRLLAKLFLTMRQAPVLLLAKVNGHAIAGGCGLVAACDVSVVSSAAKLGFTETRIGFVPALVSVLLRGKISETHARDLLLSGRLITAEKALRINLVNRCPAASNLTSETDAYLEAFCRNTSRQAVATTKQLMLKGIHPGLEVQLEEAARINAHARGSEDCQTGIAAFLKKEDSPWARRYDQDHRDPA